MKMMLSEYEGFCIFGWETIQQKSSRGKSIKVALDLVHLKVTSRSTFVSYGADDWG